MAIPTCANNPVVGYESLRQRRKRNPWLSLLRRSPSHLHPGVRSETCSGEERGVVARECPDPGTTSTRIGLSTKTDVLLADEAPIAELDELRTLIQEGQERGFLTIEQITTTLEEVEITKEQLTELHQHLDHEGIAI